MKSVKLLVLTKIHFVAQQLVNPKSENPFPFEIRSDLNHIHYSFTKYYICKKVKRNGPFHHYYNSYRPRSYFWIHQRTVLQIAGNYRFDGHSDHFYNRNYY